MNAESGINTVMLAYISDAFAYKSWNLIVFIESLLWNAVLPMATVL